ncbi:hypothetical protein Tco_0465071 [Tanacetum coccineum]
MAESKSAKKIDWNDHSVIRYHTLKMKPKTVAQARKHMIKYLKNQGNYKISNFKGMSYNDIRPIFEKIWDFNHNFKPMEHETETMKSPEKTPEKMKFGEKMKEDDVVKEPGAKRKKSIPRKSTRKRQRMEEDAEKEELKGFLDIIPREDVSVEVESISTKFPIVDWKTYILTETFMYYQVFRGDGSSKNYKVLSEMLEDFDRQDVEELYRLVKEKYSASRLGLQVQKHEYKLLSWRLYDFCGIHILLMENGLAIHMLTENKYPLSQEMISKMLKKRLEVDHESSQAIELLRIDQGVGSTSGIRACALRNFDLGKMELENSQNNALAKLPMLKLGEYEMWEIRIKQYFQIQDYALWGNVAMQRCSGEDRNHRLKSSCSYPGFYLAPHWYNPSACETFSNKVLHIPVLYEKCLICVCPCYRAKDDEEKEVKDNKVKGEQKEESKSEAMEVDDDKEETEHGY